MTIPFTDFTVRDLNRQPAKVLEACDRTGSVRIRSRSGKVYCLQPEPAAKKAAKPAYPDFAARRKAMGMPKMTKAQREALDRMIAGE